MRTPLSKDTKAVLRVLRKGQEDLLKEVHRIANALGDISYVVADLHNDRTGRAVPLEPTESEKAVLRALGKEVAEDDS